MEKLIENLIIRLENQKQKEEKQVDKNAEIKDSTLILITAGKIMAFDFCINELKKLIDYNNISKLKQNM